MTIAYERRKQLPRQPNPLGFLWRDIAGVPFPTVAIVGAVAFCIGALAVLVVFTR